MNTQDLITQVQSFISNSQNQIAVFSSLIDILNNQYKVTIANLETDALAAKDVIIADKDNQIAILKAKLATIASTLL